MAMAMTMMMMAVTNIHVAINNAPWHHDWSAHRRCYYDRRRTVCRRRIIHRRISRAIMHGLRYHHRRVMHHHRRRSRMADDNSRHRDRQSYTDMHIDSCL